MIISVLLIISLFLLTCYFFENSCSFCKSVIGIFRSQSEQDDKEPENKILNETVVESSAVEEKKKTTKKSVKKAVKKSKKKK